MRKINSNQITEIRPNIISSGGSVAYSVLSLDANLTPVFAATTAVYALDDISPQFDGDKTVFGLTLDTANISTIINTTIIDSKDVDVAINGSVLAPYVKQLTWPWITPYDAFKGYRVVDDKIIFYTAPTPGTQCSIILRNTSKLAQTRRYPYTPSSIALGD
jgi:hypothetical protein